MKLAFAKTPKLVQWYFHKRIWAFSRSSKHVYLTFDDGPVPEITPWVLNQLKKHKAKATFFCIGENINKYPDVFLQILKDGHAIGNHTQHHVNGWNTTTEHYLEEFELCNNAIKKHALESENLFRPPYGKMTSTQAKTILDKGYKIIMWDILSKDYDATVHPETCLANVLQNIKPGSVVIFHDSRKAEKNLTYILPKVLDYISRKGWICASI